MRESTPILLDPSLRLPAKPGDVVRWGKTYGSAQALAIAEVAGQTSNSILVLTDGVSEAESLAQQLNFFLGDDQGVALFPDQEVLPYDPFSPHQDLISDRLKILRQLNDNHRMILLSSATTLLPRLPPPAYLKNRGIKLTVGQSLNQETFREQLEDAGYQRVSQVSMHGDYAVRGSLVDFFPTGHTSPLRIDFFDDSIESLREFDPDSQVSTGRIDGLDTLPARDIPIDSNSVTEFRRRYRQRFEGNPAKSIVYREVTERRLPGGVENYLPLFFESTASIWDYLPVDTLIVSTGELETSLTTAWEHVNERYEQSLDDPERPPLEPAELYHPATHHLEQIRSRCWLKLQNFEIPIEELDAQSANLDVSSPPATLIDQHGQDPSKAFRAFLQTRPDRVLFAAESAGRRELVADLLRAQSIATATVNSWSEFLDSPAATAITIAPLEKGILLPARDLAILTEQELFGRAPARKKRRRRVQDPEALISDLTDLRAGSPVVHIEHGVGRYIGLTNLDIDATLTEFLTMEYAGGDLLHVPVSSLHLISRYTGAAPEKAPLHRLGSDQWQKAKSRAAEKIRDVAAELLDLYSRRAARTGYSYRLDTAEVEKFAAGFPFTPTDDQAKVIDEVATDLAASDPMDRLVCGDVGFGKTEVALRAAFIAASNGRQVAILVPTTLLAQQHTQVFTDRFTPWPINVAGLSRFQTKTESEKTLDGLRNGQVDIVIGTHRLLQRNVEFKDLGLVIIDEEHRFGVRHKEQLKKLRTEVDILTLTATPIPRTLNMALGSVRELSLITTPPETRLSIKTFVTTWNTSIIREACLRELKRGGQVYFVHNRVKDIQKIADEVRELIPEGKLEIAHGQMPERELERIMSDFYHRKFHILVCTAIIESGLDVPSANTIIINRADHFGLAQLHQLRGRVGRSHHQAFAYLLAPPRNVMTPDAVKRLEAVESLEDLGAGFVLATHDLEIRGAGELLGEGQSGQIQEIGFSLYNEMLSRTVKSLREGLEPNMDIDAGAETEIKLHVAALFPEDYLPDVHLRLVNYKRIASAKNEQELSALQVEMIDRFGLLPPAAKNLFALTAIRLQASPLGIRRLDLSASGGIVEFNTGTTINPATLVHLIESEPQRFSLDRHQRLRIKDDLEDPENRYHFAVSLIERLSA